MDLISSILFETLRQGL